jgi:thiosulfate/3-mercaptopyruvate sulfurtransferase
MKKAAFGFLKTIALSLWMVAPVHAARIVDTAEVDQAMARGAIVWDIREAEPYRQDHLPGAVNVGVRVCSQLRTPITWDYVPTQRIIGRLGAWGIDPRKEIILYADKGSACPYFILASLELVGADNAHVYHGGIDDWRAAGRPVASAPTVLPPVTLDLKQRPGVIVSTDEVRSSLARKDVQILDVRTPNEFVGVDVRALRGGIFPARATSPMSKTGSTPNR